MLFFTGQHRTNFRFTVPGSQLVIHAGYILPAGCFEPDGFPAPGYFAAHFRKQLQQRIKVCRFLFQRTVNHHPQLLPMGWLGLFAQPLVVAFSVGFRVLHNGQSVLNANGVAQAPDSPGAAPKVAEFSVTIRIDRRPDDVIMNVRFVYVSADHKGVIALGKPLGKLHAQAVGFLRGNLTGFERLAHMVSDHIIRSAHPPGGGDVLPLCQQKLCIGGPAVTAIAGN